MKARGDFSMIFYRGKIYSYGGCQMYEECFNDIFVFNTNENCPNKCTNKGKCTSTGCECDVGFTTHDCSLKVKCRDDCSNNGQCHNNAKCGCYPGWSGVTCLTKINCPRNCTAEINGLCQADSQCKCNPGFNGTDCGISNKTDTTEPLLALTLIKTKEIKADPISKEITKNVTISSCPNDCSGKGSCNTTTLKCNCNVRLILYGRQITQEMIAQIKY